MKDLYRLVYTSINQLEGQEAARAAAVAEILAISQRNNSKVGVTGALLFNNGCFAQVLEGPRKAVETTFERIQRDPRHSEVSVLQCEPVDARGFANWSMAFIGHSARGRALWSEIASRTGFDLSRFEGDQLFATLRAIVQEEEPSSDTQPAPSVAPISGVQPTPLAKPATFSQRAETIDIERVRAELLDSMHAGTVPAKGEAQSAVVANLPLPAERPEVVRPSSLDAAVLKAALAEERERTTDLRRRLDEARIALAIATDEVALLRRQRDHWADRARAIASALCLEPATSSNNTAGDQCGSSTSTVRLVG